MEPSCIKAAARLLRRLAVAVRAVQQGLKSHLSDGLSFVTAATHKADVVAFCMVFTV